MSTSKNTEPHVVCQEEDPVADSDEVPLIRVATELFPERNGHGFNELSKLTSHVLTVSAGEAERLLEALRRLAQCLHEHEDIQKNDDLMLWLILFVEVQAHMFLKSGADVQPWTSAVEQTQAMFNSTKDIRTCLFERLQRVPSNNQ